MALPTVGGGQQLGDGNINEIRFESQIPYTTASTSATLTTDQISSGLILANQAASGAATYTLPTGTLLDAAWVNIRTNKKFDFTIVNISTVAAEDVTVAVGTGITAYGNLTVASNNAVTDISSATFRLVRTGVATYDLYRLS